jgi:hypothetical protein
MTWFWIKKLGCYGMHTDKEFERRERQKLMCVCAFVPPLSPSGEIQKKKKREAVVGGIFFTRQLLTTKTYGWFVCKEEDTSQNTIPYH